MHIDPNELQGFVTGCLRAVGVREPDAQAVSDVLVSADLRGIDSHGVARLRRYVEGVQSGVIDRHAQAVVAGETATTVAFDGCNGLGQPISIAAVDSAIDKALRLGLGMATVRRSNHFGFAGYYALRAASRGLFAIVGTNASPQVAPTGGARPMFGTNPIAICFPTQAGRPFMLDAATSIVPRGKLERMRREGGRMPPGWAVDPAGLPVTDLDEVIDGLKARDGYCLLPLGGAGEQYGGHKGYGLATAIELFCGPLAGAMWGRHLYGSAEAGLGHFFLCGQIDAFLPLDEFQKEAGRMLDELRLSPKERNCDRILVAGERENETKERREKEGIPLTSMVVDDLRHIADDVNVRLPCMRSDRLPQGND